MRYLAIVFLLLSTFLLSGWTTIESWLGTGFAPVQRVALSGPIPGDWNYDPDCISFDGLNDYAGTTDMTGLPATGSARTLMAWIFDSDPTSSDYDLGFMGYGQNSHYKEFIFGTHGQELYFGSFVNDWKWSFSRESRWKHIAISLPEGGNVSSLKAYVNGASLGAGSLANGSDGPINTVTSGYTLSIGGWPVQNFYSSCKMAEVAIFNKELSQSDIQTLYPYKLSGTEIGLIRLYHCDEGTGSTLADSVGGYNLTISGATWGTK